MAAENVALIETLRARLVEVQRARDELAEARRRLAESREAERLQLARELHDRPVQDLQGLRLRLGAITEEIDDDTSRMRLAALQGELLQVIGELRALCRELRPPALAPFGLAAAIRSHAGRFQEAHPELEVQVDLMHDGQTLPERVRLALFRIYQEALSNVMRHAGAGCVLIRFYLDEERILLEISDDGCGFEVPDRWILLARRGCLGLLGAAERADSIGGRLEVESAPGKGTVVRVVASLPAPQSPVDGQIIGLDAG
ncbi:MAG: sensor histidine kinase [Anaerolineae bacterium]